MIIITLKIILPERIVLITFETNQLLQQVILTQFMKITYKPEVDGLRTIAVLSVILYHLKIDNFFSGGFLGVDVFFVISGFLITSIIVKELSVTNSFSFVNFYKRRIRKLMPVFFIVLISSIVAGWFILLPSQFTSFAKSGLKSICFISNFFWYNSALDYDAQSSLLEPLLHTWTLSVEEQFYIIFPGLLVLIFLYFKKQFFSILVVFALASLLFAEMYVAADQAFCFYLLPTRFWELTGGGVIAILNFKNVKLNRNNFLFKNLTSVFLIILLPCFFIFNDETKHPALITTIPVLATMGILFFAHKEDLATKLLSTKPFVIIGLLSYSLYLWHYPIYAFGRNLSFENSTYDYSLWIGLSFLLSLFSYKTIEQPFRNKNIIKTKKFIFTLTSLLFVSLILLSIIINNKGFPKRFNTLNELYSGNEIDNKILKKKRIDFYREAISKSNFNEDKTNVLIIGDSHSKDMFNSFYLNKEHYQGYSFFRTDINGWESRESPEFEGSELINNSNIVVLCFRLANKTWLFEVLEEFVLFLQKINKRVIICLNGAEFRSYGPIEVFDNYIREFGTEIKDVDQSEVQRYFYENRRVNLKSVNNSILNFAQKMNIEIIDRYSLVCNDEFKMCYGITPDGKKAYTDGSHLSLSGAKYFGSKFIKKKILLEPHFSSSFISPLEIKTNNNIDSLKVLYEEEIKKLDEIKTEFKHKLNNGNYSPKERRELWRAKKDSINKRKREILSKRHK